MKTVVFAPAALERLADILAWTVERFGEAQAETYAARLAGRLEALAAGEGPKARPCERLMRGVREASGLAFYREGAHYLILRERPETLEVVEIFHQRMNLEAHLDPSWHFSASCVPYRLDSTRYFFRSIPTWPHIL